MDYDPAVDDLEEAIEKIHTAWQDRLSESIKLLGKRLSTTKV
jgi:hypothetical protein